MVTRIFTVSSGSLAYLVLFPPRVLSQIILSLGIDMVKISDPEAAAKYNIVNSPSLVFFRKRVPLLYDGDLGDEEKVLSWLTAQDVFEIKNEIEEVNRKMLDKLLDENEFLAVYFCKCL